MSRTQVRGTQLLDTSIQNVDLDTITAGKAVITKVVAGSCIKLDSTGVDVGTGNVTINVIDSYVHQQDIASNIWVCTHNLNKIPSVVIFDSAGSEVICDRQTIDLNTTRIIASAPFSGKAHFN